MAVHIHGAAQILQELLIALSLGSRPSAGGAVWPVYADKEPTATGIPDNIITTYDTQGTMDGREAIGGQWIEHPGFQIRIRSALDLLGKNKARDIAAALDNPSNTWNKTIVVAGVTYTINTIHRDGGVISLPPPQGSSLLLFTINGKLSFNT